MIDFGPLARVPYPRLLQTVWAAAHLSSISQNKKLGNKDQGKIEKVARFAFCTLSVGLDEIARRAGHGVREAERFLSHVHIHGIDAGGQVETGARLRLLRSIMEAALHPGREILPLRQAIVAVPEQVRRALGTRRTDLG